MQKANYLDKKEKKMHLIIKQKFDLNNYIMSNKNNEPLVTFLRDCDLSFLAKDDFRRINNIQPFPRLVICPSKEFDFEKAVPLETRIIRKGRKRNSFIIFGKFSNEFLSCEKKYEEYYLTLKNQQIFLDKTFWSFQRMDQLSDVCLAARGPSNSWSGCCCKKIWTKGEHICHACEFYNKPGLILVRFDTNGKAVEYYMESYMEIRGFRGAIPIEGLFADYSGDIVEYDTCIAAEDNKMQRWERKNDVPFGTAYSFEDYEPSLKTKGDLFWNWQNEKWIYDNFEPKYYLCDNPDSRKRSLDLTVILFPENLDFEYVKQYFSYNEIKGNFFVDVDILKEIKKHWNDENWFEPKHKEGELEYWPSLSVQELLGIWPKEICEKIGNCPDPKNFSYLKE